MIRSKNRYNVGYKIKDLDLISWPLVLRVHNKSSLSFARERILISTELLGDSEMQQEIDGRISVDVADVGRTF